MVLPAGFINIKVLLTFNKLKKLTTKVEDVAAAFEEDSDVVEVRKSTKHKAIGGPMDRRVEPSEDSIPGLLLFR